MPKHYKEMMDELINKMDEDAPANAVAHGGVDMNPTGKKKKKDDVGTTADAEDVLRRTIMKKLGGKIKENTDKDEVKVVAEKETFYDKFIKDLANNTPHEEMFDEQAPNTADAMKRYKAGKAGFTDKAHLKAKGLIARSDGTKKKSDKYK